MLYAPVTTALLSTICIAIACYQPAQQSLRSEKHAPARSSAFTAFLRILCLGGPFSACAYAIISFFQAVGEGKKSFMLAIMRKGILDIPMMFILLRLIPVYGTVWATPIADVLCCVTALILMTRFIKGLGSAAWN